MSKIIYKIDQCLQHNLVKKLSGTGGKKSADW